MVRLFFLLAGLIASDFVMAQVRVIVPEEISLYVVDVEKAQVQGGLLSGQRWIEVPNGTHQIAFRYRYEKVGRDKIESFNSDLILVRFNAQDTELHFVLPQFSSLAQAKNAVAQAQWKLVDAQGVEPEQAQDSVTLRGVMLGQNFVDEVKAYNRQGGQAAVSMTYLTVDNQTLPVNTVKTAIDVSLSSLQQHYLNASEDEKAAFNTWLIDQGFLTIELELND